MGRAAGKRQGGQPGGLLWLNFILKFLIMHISMKDYLSTHDVPCTPPRLVVLSKAKELNKKQTHTRHVTVNSQLNGKCKSICVIYRSDCLME